MGTGRVSETAPREAESNGGFGKDLFGYLLGKLTGWQRLLVGWVGLALLPVMFVPVLPIWKIGLVAPQYREGLTMLIFANDLQGDLNNINILNHYIGMQEIDATSFPEFGYMPWVLTVFGAIAILAAIVRRRWLAFLGWLGFATFGTVMMMHFADWLQDYGTNLDPKAALDFGAFTPKLLGVTIKGNFEIASFPHFGGYILFAAGALGPLIVLIDWLNYRRRKEREAAALLTMFLAFFVVQNVSATDFVSYEAPPEVSSLQILVNNATPGSILSLPDGVHEGQLTIDRPLTLKGTKNCVLDGAGKGSVLIVQAASVSLQGFTVRNSGYELLFDDAGILLDESIDTRIEGVILRDNNHGIYVRNATRPLIRDCQFEGRRGRVHEENHGNGIHLWYVKDALIQDNRLVGHRDGLYLSFAEAALIENNVAYGQDRFGLHSMYSQRNIIRDNCFGRNTAGVALMFSNRMTMERNQFIHNRGHRTYGLLLRDCSDSDFIHNRLVDNTIGLFLDGSNRNRFRENLFAENGWGVIAYSSSEENAFSKNAFVSNDYQMSLDMRRTKNRLSEDGIGNYWSEARPYDLDDDGIGDAPHNPVGLFAFISKQYPDLTVFSGSPAVLALEIAQRSLPALQPSELIDPHPLLKPVPVPEFEGPALPFASQPGRGGSLSLAALSSLVSICGGLCLWRSR